ncbi:hypothetical protein RUM43_014030 [Polyplax serrata]|uniref:SUZ RNA-binding domain-containing n=1 Tax=Polyplax serrata TaxID=468196 RepID=A0AAN8PSY9_POLSC
MAATQEKCDVVDSWEDIDENELLEKTFPKKPESSGKTINGPLVIQGEDSLRTQYTPPEPSVKILKRPTKESRGDSTSSDVLGVANGEIRNSRQPVRTLQQRQIDYAEARLRILGEAKSPEDELDDRISKMNLNTTGVTLLRPCGVVNIVRHPRGPDGTKGFNLKR